MTERYARKLSPFKLNAVVRHNHEAGRHSQLIGFSGSNVPLSCPVVIDEITRHQSTTDVATMAQIQSVPPSLARPIAVLINSQAPIGLPYKTVGLESLVGSTTRWGKHSVTPLRAVPNNYSHHYGIRSSTSRPTLVELSSFQILVCRSCTGSPKTDTLLGSRIRFPGYLEHR